VGGNAARPHARIGQQVHAEPARWQEHQRHDVYTFGQTMAVMREIILSMPGKLSDAVSAYCSEDRIKVFEIIHGEVIEVLTALSSPESYVAVGVASATTKNERQQL
jgi:hypothetical protein